MTWYFCSGCKKRFEAPFAHHGVVCAFCKKAGRVHVDDGDVGADIRAREKSAEKADLERKLASAQEWHHNYSQQLANFKARYNSNNPDIPPAEIQQAKRSAYYVERLAQLVDDEAYYEERVRTLQRKLNTFDTMWGPIERAAGDVRAASLNVQASSGKNKLYIGDRQYVVAHTTANPDKTKNRKLRILDSASWTWGLNTSWVEGGVEAKARFRLKLNDSDARKTFPAEVITWFRDNAHTSPAVPSSTDNAALESDFLAMCKEKGRGNLLWYDRDGDERPTWTALEIACLIRRGYRFNFRTGSKIELIPPPVG